MSKFNLSISSVVTKSVEVKIIAKYLYYFFIVNLKKFEEGPIKAFIKSFQVTTTKKSNHKKKRYNFNLPTEKLPTDEFTFFKKQY